MTLEEHALLFAMMAHMGQTRKYTGDPYITHPISVAAIVKSVPHTSEMVEAAYLHDILEDTHIDYKTLAGTFGADVADMVDWLTDVSKPSDGNRATRKAMDRDHLAEAPAEAQTIKLGDLIHNTETIRLYDPEFWKVYRQEKRDLLEVMTKGDPTLYARALALVSDD